MIEPSSTQPSDRGQTPIRGAVLCGGMSMRFGSDKTLAVVNGQPMGAIAVAAMRSAGVDPVVAVAANAEHGGRVSQALAIPAIADRWPGEGPLGGLLTAMLWYRSGPIVVLPCDLPLVTGHALQPLLAKASTDPGAGVVARTDRGPNCTIGVWPAAFGPRLKRLFDDGARRLDTVLEVGRTHQVEVKHDVIRDADTVDELRLMLERD